MYGYEWTDEYGIFRLTIEARIQKEIRPVFKEELDFFGMDQYWDYPKDTDAPILWAEGIRRYVLNGVCIAEAQGGGFYTKPIIKRYNEERIKLQAIDIERLYEVNRPIMISLQQLAVEFIQTQYKHYTSRGYAFICAFSGGKDSLVLLDLVDKALPPSDFYVVFSNTGMELSDTLHTIEKAKIRWPHLRFEEAKCHLDPQETWDEFGPPGRRLRWCCSVHKSVPTILKLREITGNYNAKAVVYEGVRAEESAKRAKYDEVSEGGKNISQVNCRPIFNWNGAELYIYLLYNNLLINDAYRYGLNRVGCTVCPLSSQWRDSLSYSFYPDDINPLLDKVKDFIVYRGIDKKEQKKYLEGNGWRTRMGGKGLKNGGNRVTEVQNKDSITINISSVTQQWDEVLKILGVCVETGKGDTIVLPNKRQIICKKTENDNGAISAEFSPKDLMDRYCLSAIRGIANKTAYCIGCKACEVQCPTGAFKIMDNGKILIRENKCIHCYNCISFTEKGCLVAKSLYVTQEGSAMNFQGFDRYNTFGFRENFFHHFCDMGVECFNAGVLGTKQYGALNTWLREAGILEAEKSKAGNITPLGEKLLKMNPYNPFVWAVMWANLAYNSTVCRWFCLNIENGSSFDKNTMCDMIGDVVKLRTRQNGVTALLDTFKSSPIGSALNQAVMIDKYCIRAGWDYPHAVAILYSLYLYAEHTGRRSFTFTELVNAHDNSDAMGMSPADAFGIDVKQFREIVQGLAVSFPNHIRVSFVANLDNIILEKYTSLEILDLAEED